MSNPSSPQATLTHPSPPETLRTRIRRFLGALVLPLALCALGHATPAGAAVCKVEPTGIYPYTNVPDALSGDCDGSDPAGDEILVLCQSGTGPCIQDPFELVGRQNVRVSVQGDPTVFEGTGSGGAIFILGSSGIVIEGVFDATSTHDPAISIFKSEVQLAGLPSERYATLHADTDAALYVAGASQVFLDTVSLSDSPIGLRTDEAAGRGPHIDGWQMQIFGNQQAALISGGTSDCGDPSHPAERSEVVFDLADDFQPNYVEANEDGFIVEGGSILELRHTILLGNLRTSQTLRDTALLRGRGCGTINAQQILAYDNDPWADAGRDITQWWPSGDGSIAKTEEYSNIVIESSTLVHNQMEYGMWPTTLKGSITFLTSVADQTGIKGVPCSSGYFFSDGNSSVWGSGLSNYDGCYCNYHGPVPPPTPICPPNPLDVSVDPGGWDTSNIPATSPWPNLPKHLYRMLHSPFIDLGPGNATLGLYPGVPWATDQTAPPEQIGSRIDWGYHSF